MHEPFPFAANQPFFLRIVVYEQGFAFYKDGHAIAQFAHRMPLKDGQKLYVQLSAGGDYGEVCSLACSGLWAGHADHTHIESLDVQSRTCLHGAECW